MDAVLYIVATPIGNLEDISARALRVLGEVAVIACEDTRQTSKLLRHYGIRTPLVSYHEHNERERAEELVARLRGGQSVAVVTDGGTPLISDPGYRLVKLAAEAGVTISPIPGASALLAAVAAAGLPTDEFHFCGFLPAKSSQRRKRIEMLAGLACTLVIYEAPHRLLDCLADIVEVCYDPPVVVAREMTKMHEEFVRGPASEVLAELGRREQVRGEVTIIVGPARPQVEPADADALRGKVDQLVTAGARRMDAIKEVARRHGLSKREVYEVVVEG